MAPPAPPQAWEGRSGYALPGVLYLGEDPQTPQAPPRPPRPGGGGKEKDPHPIY